MKMLMILLLLGLSTAARLPKQYLEFGFAPGRPVQPPYYPNYLLHNIFQLDPNRPISTVISDGNPGVSHVHSSFHYFSTPLYDYSIHLSPLFPNYQPVIPSYVPQLPSSTPRPLPDDDGIEKLDQKLDPAMSDIPNNDKPLQDEDDTVTIDAI